MGCQHLFSFSRRPREPFLSKTRVWKHLTQKIPNRGLHAALAARAKYYMRARVHGTFTGRARDVQGTYRGRCKKP